MVVDRHRDARAGSCYRNDLRDTPSSVERRARRESDRTFGGAFASFDQDQRRRTAGASWLLPICSVVLDFRFDEHALWNFAPSRASDRAAMERSAWNYFVHHAAARDAIYGGNRAGTVWADRRRASCAI